MAMEEKAPNERTRAANRLSCMMGESSKTAVFFEKEGLRAVIEAGGRSKTIFCPRRELYKNLTGNVKLIRPACYRLAAALRRLCLPKAGQGVVGREGEGRWST